MTKYYPYFACVAVCSAFQSYFSASASAAVVSEAEQRLLAESDDE
jgi:hypothetical protein